MIAIPPLAFVTWPMLLWGVALGGIPVIIHLLHKRKYRETDWAAMRFLVEAARKQSRRLRLEQLILMAVRMLILLFLVAALLGEYTESSEAYVGDGGATQRIIVVDSSFSMDYRPDEQSSRFEAARAEALKIAEAARPADLLNLVRVTGASRQTVVQKPAHPTEAFAAEIRRLTPTQERGDLLVTLNEAASLLEAKEAGDVGRREVYVLSDFQRGTWLPDSASQRAQIRKAFEGIAEKSTLMLIDIGRERARNTAVTRFAASEPFVIAGRPVRLEAVVRNFGELRLGGRSVELYLDGKLADTREVDLPPHGDARIEWVWPDESRGQRALSSGEHHFEVRLQDDALPLDNRRWLSLPVRDQIEVLLVNGKPSGRAPENATFFLEKALNPSTAGRQGRGAIRPRTITEGELAGIDLGLYDCVFVCNVKRFTRPEVQRLRAYAESGGGVVFCLGDQIDVENYNAMLYQDGTGLLPARLTGRARLPRDATRAFAFDTAELSHPILAPFVGNSGAGLETVFTFEYVRAGALREGGARAVLRFQNTGGAKDNAADPVIVEAPVGRGRSILVTTSVDAQWSTWASINPSFLPMMHELVHFAVAGRWNERQREVGQPLVRSVPARAASLPASVALKLPDGRETSIPLTERNGFASLSYAATARSGLYELLLGPARGGTELFAVNVDAAESDLSKADEDELRSELLAGIDFLYRGDWKSTDRALDVAGTERSELTGWLLVAAFCLVLVELLMAWNFSYGLLLLYVVVAAGFVRQTLFWTTLGGIGTALAFAAGAALIVFFTCRGARATSRSKLGWGKSRA